MDDIIIDHHARFIGPDGVARYAILARHPDQDTATCYPTIATRVERTGMSRNRVHRTLRRLATYGLLRMQEQPFASTGKAWTGYLVTLFDPNPVAVSLRQTEGGSRPWCELSFGPAEPPRSTSHSSQYVRFHVVFVRLTPESSRFRPVPLMTGD